MKRKKIDIRKLMWGELVLNLKRLKLEDCFSDIQNVILTHKNDVFTPDGS